MLKAFQKVLERVSKRHIPHPSWEDPRRKLQMGEYLSLYLFGLVNPALESMRAVCEATKLARVQQAAGSSRCSAPTFSEMQHLIDPALLEDVFKDLTQKLQQRQGSQGSDKKKTSWRINDSSVFKVLQRMDWAYFQTNQGQRQCAVRMHVSLDLVSLAPVSVGIDKAKMCERKLWKKSWEPGAGQIGDRNYSQNYNLLRLLERRDGLFLVRLREKQVHLRQIEELPVGEACRREGVTRQVRAILGRPSGKPGPRVRVVWIQAKDGTKLMLATNQKLEEMSAQEISQLYRQRWQIELFFRWIKCILGCRHFLAESPKGVAIQLYLALIAAVLVQLYLGERPNKRMWETLQLYFMGFVSDEELLASISRQIELQKRRRAKKS